LQQLGADIVNESVLEKVGHSVSLSADGLTIAIGAPEAGDLDLTPLAEAKVVKSSFTTKGRGFSGAMKRWNFGGGPASHGHRFGRRTVSIGNCRVARSCNERP